MVTNKAAWLDGPQQYPLTVREAPYESPGEGELLVRIHAVAMNPADWKIVKKGGRVTTFPMIIGQDVAGEVVEVGKSVNKFTKGDRIIAHMLGLTKQSPARGAFQLYGIASACATCHIPSKLTMEQASVLPLAVSTATVGLYTWDQLALPLPSLERKESSNQVVLVWGGSSSVGGIAIQLARLSGLKVATTCSSRNFDYVKALGAEWAFDYSSASIVEDIVSALEDSEVVGIFNAIGGEPSGTVCGTTLSQVKTPTERRHIATVPPAPAQLPEGVTAQALGGAGTMFGDDKRSQVAEYIWQTFLPPALSSGVLLAVPEPMVVGQGLEKIQEALDILEKGVSAKKVVVRLV